MSELASPTTSDEATVEPHLPVATPRTEGRLTRFDWLFLLAVLTVQAIWVWRQTSDYWFVDDFWAMLGDGDLTWRDLVDEHGGHWTAYHRLAANVFFDTSGMNYWPTVGLFSVVSWGGFACWSAWATNRLGGSRFVSVCVGILIGMGIGVVFKPWLIGKLIGHVSWVTASMIISGNQRNSRRWLLFGVLVVGVSSGFQTVCFLGAAVLYCTLRRSLRYWLPAVFGALAVYLGWRRIFGATALDDGFEPSLGSFAEFPFHMFDVVASALSRYIGVSFASATVLTAVIGFGLLYRQFAGRATHHESLAALTILAFTATTVSSRILAGVSPASAPRYTLPIILYLLLGFGSTLQIRLPAPTTLRRIALFGVLVLPMFWVLSTQVDSLRAGYRFEDRRHTATQADVSTAVFLLNEGIPFDETARVRPGAGGGGSLTVRQLSTLVDDGLRLDPAPGNIAEMQALLTIQVVDGSTLNADRQCGALDARSQITSDLIHLAGDAGNTIEISWTDLAGGPGAHQFQLDADGKLSLSFIALDQASYWLDPLGGDIDWCQ